jgi:hypothetical protein
MLNKSLSDSHNEAGERGMMMKRQKVISSSCLSSRLETQNTHDRHSVSIIGAPAEDGNTRQFSVRNVKAGASMLRLKTTD